MTPTREERIKEIRGRYYAPPAHMIPYNPSFCAGTVPNSEWPAPQCRNKPGHGLGGLFCKQHAKNNPETGE